MAKLDKKGPSITDPTRSNSTAQKHSSICDYQKVKCRVFSRQRPAQWGMCRDAVQTQS